MFNFLSSKNSFATVSAVEAKQLIKNIQINKNLIILDVRTPGEFSGEKIDPSAININIQDQYFETRIEELDKKLNYLVYCQRGGRSTAACQIMSSLGFKNIYNLSGGISAF